MTALNPNHPTIQILDGHWQKVCAALMHKFGEIHVVLTERDIETMPQSNFMAVQEQPDGLHVYFVDENTAHALARQHGGLPA